MIGLDVIEIRNEWRNEFENEHDVISSLEILFLVFLESILFLFFLVCLLKKGTHIWRFSDVIVIHFFKLDTFYIEIVFV